MQAGGGCEVNDDDMPVWLAAILSIIFGLIGYFVGGSAAEKSTHESAIKAGVAEYYLDQNHERQFRWKESK